MKRCILLTALLLAGVAATADTNSDAADDDAVHIRKSIHSTTQDASAPRISFDCMEHDFGTLEFRSDPRTFAFRFLNTGDAPLVIIRSEQSCTCLSVKYPRQPVMPQEEGVIEVTYSPKKDTGPFNNYVKIYSNTPDRTPVVLFVRGEVVRK